MKKWIAWTAAISIWFAATAAAVAQISEAAPDDSDGGQPGLRKLLSDRPFFGTQPVLSLGGNYINTPKEDFEETGTYSLPLSLDEMDGVIAEVTFGDAKKPGEWQLSYRYKVMAMDSDWQSIADANAGLTLSDRRSQVLKASFNIREWWKFGLSAVVEDRLGTDAGGDPYSFGLNSRESLGFQIDTLLKF
jgi:hypothetical protein